MKKTFFRLLGLTLLCVDVFPVVLEDLLEEGVLEAVLEGRILGYYVGSFDPVHLAHQAVAEKVLSESLCDFVIMYPVWGGDDYKKKESVEMRLKMLFAALADHSGIIVTKLQPRELQQALTDTIVAESPHKKAAVGFGTRPKSFIKKIIGIVGSDQALALGMPERLQDRETKRKLWLAFFMRGYIIHEAYYDTDKSLASISALPVSSFIVSIRNEDDVSVLNNHIGDREFLTISLEDYIDDCGRLIIKDKKVGMLRTLSSSLIKDLMQGGSRVMQELLAPPVWQLIEEHGLYRRRSTSSDGSDHSSPTSGLGFR